jgi:transcription initiation factor TFIID subunit TAF12
MKRIELIIRVNKQAGSEEFYQKSQDLGMLAAQSFRGEQGRSQMTGLENMAETTLKVTDVLDYIKKQTARQRGWQKEVGSHGERFGESLKKYIESGLESFVKEVCFNSINSTTSEGKQERQEAYLELVRQSIRQIVVQYEYQVSQQEERART